MIDIDLELLKFIIYPNYDYIKDIILVIRDAYIEEYGEEYRERITKNFDGVNYVFINEIYDTKQFIKKLFKSIILESYQHLYEVFNFEFIKYKHIDAENCENFIEKELLKSNIFYIEEDTNLNVFKTNVKNYIIKMRDLSNNSEEKTFFNNQIKYIDETINKFDKITEVLKPAMDSIQKTEEKKEKIRSNLQKEFLKKHGNLLTEEERNFISNNNDYNVSKFVAESSNLSNYLTALFINDVFSVGNYSSFKEINNDNSFFINQRAKILKQNGVDYQDENIDLNDSEACLKRLNFKYIDEENNVLEGIEALKKLEQELERYNDILRQEYVQYKYLIPRDELGRKFIFNKEIMDKGCDFFKQIEFKDEEFIECQKYVNQIFLSGMENNFNSNAFVYINSLSIPATNDETKESFDIVFYLNYLVTKPIINYEFLEEDMIEENYLSILTHEAGHVSSISEQKDLSGFNIEEKYRMLNELFNEYMNGKIITKLANIMFKFSDGKKIINENRSVYMSNYFLLEPFMNEYEEVFKKATMENNPKILEKLMGKDLLEEYVTIINEFFNYHEKKYNFNLKIYDEAKDYVDLITMEVNDIYSKVSLKNNKIIQSKSLIKR